MSQRPLASMADAATADFGAADITIDGAGELINPRRLRIAVWVLGMALALLQAWWYRNWINGDSISYLDMSDGVMTGEWTRLVNGTWSPMYPALLGIFTGVLKPSAQWQFTLAHLVNVLCFAVAFAGFEFLLRSIVDTREREAGGYSGLPVWAYLGLGYTLFLWASLGLLTVIKITPDLLMSAFVYLSMGVVVRIKHGQDSYWNYALLGLMLSLAYLAKAPMFLLGRSRGIFV